MKTKLNQKQNKQFWENRAGQSSGHEVSWWDINMKKIEVETIAGLLTKNDHLLDVGCSNGVATAELQARTKGSFVGIDYSETAIEQARKIQNSKLEFRCQDVLTLSERNVYDKAITIRCLINLMNDSDQMKALKKIQEALKPNGLLIMCEAFSGAFHNLNRVRSCVGLDPLAIPPYNNYLDEEKITSDLRGLFEIERIIKHSSLYYIGTRVFQYLSLDKDPKESDSALHRFFSKFNFETKRSGDFGPNKVYVCRKL